MYDVPIRSPSALKTLKSLQNSAIRIFPGLHRHIPLFKLKQLSGLVSLSERASSQRKKYFSRLQAYGSKHVVYNDTFALKAAGTNGHSSWNQFQLEVPNWSQYSPYAYPFTDTPPWEMSPPICQAELIPINKNKIPIMRFRLFWLIQISKLCPIHRKIYFDGSV